MSTDDAFPINLGFRVQGLRLDKRYYKTDNNVLKNVFDQMKGGSSGLENDVSNFRLWRKHYGISSVDQSTKKSFASWCLVVLKQHNVHFDLDRKLLATDLDATMKRLKETFDKESEKSKHTSTLNMALGDGDKTCYDIFTSFGVDEIEKPKEGVNKNNLNAIALFTYNTLYGKNQYHAPPHYVRRSNITICVEDVKSNEFWSIFEPATMSRFNVEGKLLNVDGGVDTLPIKKGQLSDGYGYFWLLYQTDVPRRELEHIVKDYVTHTDLAKAVDDEFDSSKAHAKFVKSLEYVSFVARCIQNAQIWFGKFCEFLEISTMMNNGDYLRKTVKRKMSSNSPVDVVVQLVNHKKVAKSQIWSTGGGFGIARRVDRTVAHTWRFETDVETLRAQIQNDMVGETVQQESIDRNEETNATQVNRIENEAKVSESTESEKKVDEKDVVENVSTINEDVWSDEDEDEDEVEVENEVNVDTRSLPMATEKTEPNIQSIDAENEKTTSEAPKMKVSEDDKSPNTAVVLKSEWVDKDDKTIKKTSWESKLNLANLSEVEKDRLKDLIESHTVVLSPAKNSNLCDGNECYSQVPLHVPEVVDVSRLLSAVVSKKKISESTNVSGNTLNALSGVNVVKVGSVYRFVATSEHDFGEYLWSDSKKIPERIMSVLSSAS